MTLPKIIAHRGASGHAPENTLAAFQLALDQKADGIELDVMLTADNQIVVIHDDTVDRTTDGSGRVRDMTLDQLKHLDAGDGEKIPTLEEVLVRFGGKYLINIELKNYTTIFDGLPVRVAKMVKDLGLTDTILFSSFNAFNLPRVRRHLPGATLGLLTAPNQARLLIWKLFKYDALHPYFSDVDEGLVADCHSRQKQINVWTVNEPEDILRMAELHTDSIITNFPEMARQILEV
mgnify:CR=1 FL=1